MQDTASHPPVATGPDLAGWVRLTVTPGVGPATCRLLLDSFATPARVFAAPREQLAAMVGSALAQALRHPAAEQLRRVDAALAWAEAPGNAILNLADPAYPPLLRNIADQPALLYVSGRASLLTAPCLAMVGSRNASVQGKINAEVFAQALSMTGLTIVSGLALGIDTAAHVGALQGAGATIAVVGTGPDIVYPARNRELWRRIAGQGCVLSEYAPGTPPLAHNFPQRNRIISGLSAGVLVVEAAARSGSLITARLAAGQGGVRHPRLGAFGAGQGLPPADQGRRQAGRVGRRRAAGTTAFADRPDRHAAGGSRAGRACRIARSDRPRPARPGRHRPGPQLRGARGGGGAAGPGTGRRRRALA